jgi:endonuclease YncB( thermonuclease family)
MRGWNGAAAFAAAGALIFGGFGAMAQERPQVPSVCRGDTIASGSAGRIIDGRTFALADGREVRLAAIEVPPLPVSPLESGPAPGGIEARDALATLLLDGQAPGMQVTLKQADAQKIDRYGRLIAYVFTVRDDTERLVQADLVAGGHARVAARVGNRDCATELLRRETGARAAKLGLWASSYYDLLSADRPTDVLAERGHFAVVEGKVLSVRESGATIYVNFGRRWTEDFTVTILKRSERNFTVAGLEPKQLAGRYVRVRGWIEERGGPWIEAARPEQIEFVERK